MKRLVIVFTVMLMLVGMGAAYASGYLLNTQSGKFHYASCRTIKHPNSAKFVPVESREEAIALGYKPCGVCRP
ncbi:nuclease [Anaerovibrio sp.]|uniref:nuclease n=1 Tax=Anaerovibrio sp. TaxID=1872532 RepID=UPI003F18384F